MAYLFRAVLLSVILLFLPSSVVAQEFTGYVTITDGDTIRMGDVRVRLWGIDAPEQEQTCGSLQVGRLATEMLASLIDNRPVTCNTMDIDRYGRVVAQCAVAGSDLGHMMVQAGWAFDYRRFSGGYYGRSEDVARAGRRGAWSANCMAPWDWRRR